MIASATSPLSLAGRGPSLNVMEGKWPQSKAVSQLGEVNPSAAQSYLWERWPGSVRRICPCQDHSRECREFVFFLLLWVTPSNSCYDSHLWGQSFSVTVPGTSVDSRYPKIQHLSLERVNLDLFSHMCHIYGFGWKPKWRKKWRPHKGLFVRFFGSAVS